MTYESYSYTYYHRNSTDLLQFLVDQQSKLVPTGINFSSSNFLMMEPQAQLREVVSVEMLLAIVVHLFQEFEGDSAALSLSLQSIDVSVLPWCLM